MSSDIAEESAAIDGRAELSQAERARRCRRIPWKRQARRFRAERRKLHPGLRRLLGGPGPEQRRIERFLSRNRFPLVERDAVTFVFEGEADAVYLHHFMRGVPGGLPFERVPGTNLWHLRLPVPKGSRFEYKFDVVRNGHGAWINDPLNPAPRDRSLWREFGRQEPWL